MEKKGNCFNRILEHISACMMPIVPGLIAGGLMKLVILILGYTGIFTAFPDAKIIMEAISNAPFYFLPIMVAYTAANHFNTDIICAMAAAGTFIIPEFVVLMERGEPLSFFGIPVYQMTYAYTVFPIIVLIYLMSILEHALSKRIKGILNEIFLRLIVITITALMGMLLIGPAVGILSQGVLAAIEWMQINIPVVAWAVFGVTAPLQVLTGVHWVFVSLVIQNLGEFGIENGFMVGYFMLTMALTAVSFVTMLRSKEQKKKTIALTSLITVFFTGTSEPALYGVCLTDKIALLAAMAGGLVGGIYQGIVTINTYVYSFPTVFSILIFQSEKDATNLMQAAIAGAISFSVAFVIMFIRFSKRKNFK